MSTQDATISRPAFIYSIITGMKQEEIFESSKNFCETQ
jgi:hypothetical protein